MKKPLITLVLACAALSVAAQQSSTPVQKHSVATGSFWSQWYVSAHVAATSFRSDHATVSAAPLKGYRTRAALALAVGKWFTPGLGLRTRFDGFWGRSAYTTSAADNAMRYWSLQEQALFNLSNLLYGYNTRRTWSVIPYAGGGVARNITAGTYAMGLSLGVLNQWRLTDRLSVDLDLQWAVREPDFDGSGSLDGHGLRTKDQALTLSVGVSWRLSAKAFQRTPDVATLRALSQSQIDALNAQLADEMAENARLRALINQQAPAQ